MTISTPETNGTPGVIATLAGAEYDICPLCGEAASKLWWFRGVDEPAAVAASLAPAGKPGWWIVRCVNCGLGRVDPMPRATDLTPLYDEAYFTTGTFAGATHAGGMGGHLSIYDRPGGQRASLRWHGGRLAHLESVSFASPFTAPIAKPQKTQQGLRRGRLLDVGCGAGYFLDAARAAGWQASGVEVSPMAAQVGRERLGLEIYQGTLADAQFAAGHFDVVTMFEVLEHLRDPASTLAEAWRILRPGGVLAIQVPNDLRAYRNLAFSSANRWWVIPPLHLHYFTAAALAAWLAAYDFQVIYLSTAGSLGTDAITLLRARGIQPGRFLTAALRRLPGPLDRLLRAAGRHTELLAYAAKRR